METLTKFKSWEEVGLQVPFIQNYLTEVNTVKEGKTKKLGSKTPVNALLRAYMKDFGFINAYATTNLRTEKGEDWGVEFNAFNITEDFPPENEHLIKQLYGYTEGLINIGLLPGDKNDEDCAFAFDYNLKNGAVKFKRLYYGSTTDSREFTYIGDMLQAIKQVEDINELFTC